MSDKDVDSPIMRSPVAPETKDLKVHKKPSSSSSSSLETSPTTNGYHPSALPTAYRPGRLSHVEILERIFPFQKRTVLELVLQGCNGDLVKAIEHFLSAQDTIMAQQQIAMTTGVSRGETPNGFHPYITSFSPFRPAANGGSKIPFGGVKSAFTPLSPTSSYPGLHSAFTSRSTGFSTEALLGRTGMLPHSSRARELLGAAPHFPYPSLAHIPTSLAGGFAPPFLLNPYRGYSHEQISPSDKTPLERSAERSRDSEHTSDGPCDDHSPRATSKDRD